MPASKRSLSFSLELDTILGDLARARKEDRSRLVETLLRESPLIQGAIAEVRGTGRAENVQTKKGRSVEKLRALARVGDAAWRRRVASGQVKYPGRAT